MHEDWSEPGVSAAGAGVFRIPLPLPGDALRAVNVYLVEDGSGVTLIDAGWALERSRVALEQALALLGRELGDVRRFLVTHLHRDHFTQAVALRRELGMSVSLGRGEEPSLDLLLSGKPPMAAQWSQLAASGAEELLRRLLPTFTHRDPLVDYERPDEWLDEGQQIQLEDRVLEVVPTPGHTRGHVVFVDRTAGVLFAGDHVLPHITPSIAFEPAPSALPLQDYLGSLARVRAMDDLRLLPAHGPITSSTHQRIDELLSHHEVRLTACADAVERGSRSAYEVAHVLPWTRHARALEQLDGFNQMLAVIETRAHLKLLVTRGRLAERHVSGVDHFSSPPS